MDAKFEKTIPGTRAAIYLGLVDPVELLVLKDRSAEHFSDDNLLLPNRTFTSCNGPFVPDKVV